MIRKELTDVLKSTKTKLIMLIMIIIPVIDWAMHLESEYGDFWKHPEAYGGSMSSSMITHPSMQAFLSGTTSGHMPQMLLLWLLPVYLLMLHGDSYIREVKLGYHSIIATRSEKKKVYWSKLTASFICSFGIMLVTLVLNYLLCWVSFGKGTFFHGLERIILEGPEEAGYFKYFCLAYPVIAYCIYIIMVSILAGICGAACCSMGFWAKSYKTLYGLALVAWFLMIIFKYSITYLMQPFIEYGPEKMIPAFLIFIAVVLMTVISGYVTQVKHERL